MAKQKFFKFFFAALVLILVTTYFFISIQSSGSRAFIFFLEESLVRDKVDKVGN